VATVGQSAAAQRQLDAYEKLETGLLIMTRSKFTVAMAARRLREARDSAEAIWLRYDLVSNGSSNAYEKLETEPSCAYLF
jgi:hypothetical protein